MGTWLDDNIGHKVGDDSSTIFWGNACLECDMLNV